MPNQARIRRPPRLPSEIHESESAADFTGVAPGDGTGVGMKYRTKVEWLPHKIPLDDLVWVATSLIS